MSDDPRHIEPRSTNGDLGPSVEECQEERIEKLKEQAAELANGEMVFWESGDFPLEIQEQFWSHVVAFEEYGEPCFQPLAVLQSAGIELPPPQELDDEALPGKLWEVIHAMAAERWYLLHTDHLSDRELYGELVEELLVEETMDAPPDASLIIDLICDGSDESVHVALKHYWTEDERRRWAEDCPEDEIPEHEDLPYDRDRLLPHPDLPGWGSPGGEPPVM